MYVELRSPNIHEPENMAAYNNTILNYRDTTPFLWAGGTEIMSQKDFYPALRGNIEIISLGKIEELHHFLRNDRYAEFGAMVTINEIAQAGNGMYVRVDNTNRAERALNAEINKLAKADVETQVFTEFDEQFQVLAWLALLLLAAEIMILDRKNPLFKNVRLFKRD